MEEDPRVTRSRALILRAAHTHFVRDGYLGANVDEIAAEAGVSKRTVYNIYGGKEALFRAVVEEAIGIAERFSAAITGGPGRGADILRTDDLERTDDLVGSEDLEGIAERLVDAVLSDRVVPLRRLLIGESRRFPELAREYYERAPGLVLRTLAAYLPSLPDLRIDDPEAAADHFAFLVLGPALDRALFAADVPVPDHRRTRAAVAAFRRAHAR